ncbi:MAG: Ig-like domain-containing protein [Pseudomonadota bacterium]
MIVFPVVVAIVLGFIAAPVFAAPFCSGEVRAVVTDIYPSADTLPSNTLRFYVYFSEPMRRDADSSFVSLENATGQAVPGAFLPTRYGLWSSDGRRLTIVLDPGRVKTGLATNKAQGRALQAGESYRLTIGANAVDARGCALKRATTKAFDAVAADVSPPQVEDWVLMRPGVDTTEPLIVKLDGVYDHASLAYRLRVYDAADKPIAGRIAVASAESAWLFTPAQPWADTTYRLVVRPELEDVSGNRPGTLFDQPLVASTNDPPTLSRAFAPQP